MKTMIDGASRGKNMEPLAKCHECILITRFSVIVNDYVNLSMFLNPIPHDDAPTNLIQVQCESRRTMQENNADKR